MSSRWAHSMPHLHLSVTIFLAEQLQKSCTVKQKRWIISLVKYEEKPLDSIHNWGHDWEWPERLWWPGEFSLARTCRAPGRRWCETENFPAQTSPSTSSPSFGSWCPSQRGRWLFQPTSKIPLVKVSNRWGFAWIWPYHTNFWCKPSHCGYCWGGSYLESS